MLSVTMSDAEDVLTVLAAQWEGDPFAGAERVVWMQGLVGRPVADVGRAVDRFVAGPVCPSWAEFAAELATYRSRPPADGEGPRLYRDDRRASTYVRVCQACCRRFASGDTEWRDLLGWAAAMPTAAVFERTMRTIADRIPPDTTDMDHAITQQLRSTQ